jgi:hypothetical protein
MPAVEEEDEGVCVGFRDERESKGVGIKEFVVVSTDGVKEGEVLRGDVAVVERVNGPGVVVADVPACGDDDISQEHDSEGVLRDVVPDAQRTWNGGLVCARRRRFDSELNLKRPSPPGKANSNMTNRYPVTPLTLGPRPCRRSCKEIITQAFYTHEARIVVIWPPHGLAVVRNMATWVTCFTYVI